MTDERVKPSTKPPPSAANRTFPGAKTQLYNPNRPPPGRGSRHRNHRGGGHCCRCCCWTILITILLIAATFAGFYFIYRPHRPIFTISSVKISSLKFTTATHLTTAISLVVVARNPNKNVGFRYEDTAITAVTSQGGDDFIIGQGNFPAFAHGNKNTTLLKVSVGNPPEDLDELSTSKLKSEIKNKKGLSLRIILDTKARAKMGFVKTPKTRVRVSCEGIKAMAPAGKTATVADTSGAECKVDFRFKIWKITF